MQMTEQHSPTYSPSAGVVIRVKQENKQQKNSVPHGDAGLGYPLSNGEKNYWISFAICCNGNVLAMASISLSVQSATVKLISALPSGICRS